MINKKGLLIIFIEVFFIFTAPIGLKAQCNNNWEVYNKNTILSRTAIAVKKISNSIYYIKVWDNDSLKIYTKKKVVIGVIKLQADSTFELIECNLINVKFYVKKSKDSLTILDKGLKIFSAFTDISGTYIKKRNGLINVKYGEDLKWVSYVASKDCQISVYGTPIFSECVKQYDFETGNVLNQYIIIGGLDADFYFVESLNRKDKISGWINEDELKRNFKPKFNYERSLDDGQIYKERVD